jgi:hypothetical protein
MAAPHTFVENGHGFIGGSDLYLEEESFLEIATRAGGLCSIDILPGCCTSQNIIDHLASRKGLLGHHGIDGT